MVSQRIEKRRLLEKRTDSYSESLDEARNALSKAIDSLEEGSINDSFDAYETAQEHMERARRRGERVLDAFDDMDAPAPRSRRSSY